MNTKKRVPGRMIPEKIDILMQFIRQARQGLSFFAQSNEPCVDGMKARRRVLAPGRMDFVPATYGECRDSERTKSSNLSAWLIAAEAIS